VNDRVMNFIEELSLKLGVASEYIFEVLVTQQIINGILWLVFAPTITAALIYLTYLLHKKYKQADWENEDHWMFGMITTGFCAIVGIVVTFISIPVSINQLINPEYYAIKEILSVFQK
jgi:hypothetical protein